MGDIVNLRQMRKSRARSEADRRAQQNRIDYGLSKSQKQQADAVKQAQNRKLDGHVRQGSDSETLS